MIMRKMFFISTAIIATASMHPAFSQTHPRLFFGESDIAALRAKTGTEPFASMMAVIENDAQTATEGSEDYTNDMRAVNAAFMHVLTGENRWADSARAHVDPVINGTQWANTGIKGLTLFMNGKSVACAYDMCYGAWEATFRATVSAKLKAHADVCNDNGGTEQNTNPASNWQGIRFSAAGLCYLATDDSYDATKLDNCWTKVVRYCTENMGDSPASRGWNIEGIGYTTYPFGQFIGAYGIAQYRADNAKDLRGQMESVKWTPWTIYAVGCRIEASGTYGIHPDFGDDNPGLGGEGVYGMAFYYCPAELVPGLKFWYDRMVGAQGDGSFDRRRHGAQYGYLYYPSTVTAQDPMTIDKWRDGFVDTAGNGYLTYRNAYSDSLDMVAQLYVKLRGNKGHNGPDALSFRIIGLDSPFGVGGGRYGTKINNQDAYWRSMNTLYPVDPEATLTTNGNSGTIAVPPVSLTNGGGHVIARISANNVGATNQKRWFIADHSRLSGVEALYVIGDISDNGNWWQMCALETQAITTDANAKTFAIEGAGGSSMKGHVLYQAGAVNFTTGKRLRGSGYSYKGQGLDENNYVHFQSSDGDFLVVLTAAKAGQEHPAVSATGTWPGEVKITAGEFEVTINGDDITYGTNVVKYARNSLAPPAHAAHAALDAALYDIRGRLTGTLRAAQSRNLKIAIQPFSRGNYILDIKTRPAGRTVICPVIK